MHNPFGQRTATAQRHRQRPGRQPGRGLAKLPRVVLIQLNRALDAINFALMAIAIGLAVLDYLFFLRWEISAALTR